MKKKNQKYFYIAGIILAIALVIYFGYKPLSFVTIQGITPTTEQINWDSYPLTLSSILLGNFVSGPGNDICGDNDGRISLSNSFSNGDSLILNSKISSNYARCGDNYINAELTLPRGKLTAKCKLTSNNPFGDSAGTISSCQIGDKKIELFADADTLLNKEEQIVLDLSELTILDIQLLTTAGSNGGSAEAELILDFQEGQSCNQGETLCSDGSCKSDCSSDKILSYIFAFLIIIGVGGFVWYKSRR